MSPSCLATSGHLALHLTRGPVVPEDRGFERVRPSAGLSPPRPCAGLGPLPAVGCRPRARHCGPLSRLLSVSVSWLLASQEPRIWEGETEEEAQRRPQCPSQPTLRSDRRSLVLATHSLGQASSGRRVPGGGAVGLPRLPACPARPTPAPAVSTPPRSPFRVTYQPLPPGLYRVQARLRVG